MRVVAERAGRALGLPHRRRLRRVTRHGVAGAGAVLRGHLPVFHDLLDLGSFVLKPDFHLGRGTKAYVTRALRGIFGPPRPGPGVSPAARSPQPIGKGLGLRPGLDLRPQRAPWRDPRAPADARTRP